MQSDLPSPFDPDTHFTVVTSETSVSVDGYALGEPMYLECDSCGARELLTPEPTPGADQFNHNLVDGERCDQWYVRTKVWQQKHPEETRKILASLDDGEENRQPIVADGGEQR